MLHEIDVPVYPLQGEPKVLSEAPFLHEGANVQKSRIGSWTEIGRNTLIVESTIGDYTYDDGEVSIYYSQIGRFCSIANRVRINPGNHPMNRASQSHFSYRASTYFAGERDERTLSILREINT